MLRSHVCIQGRLWHSTAPHEFANPFALLNLEKLWNINISFAHFNTHWMFLHNLPATDFGGYCRSRRKPRKLVELDVINGTGPFAILCSKTCFVASANVVAACLLRPSILDLRSMSHHLQFAHHELPTAFPMILRRIISNHTHTTAAFIYYVICQLAWWGTYCRKHHQSCLVLMVGVWLHTSNHMGGYTCHSCLRKSGQLQTQSHELVRRFGLNACSCGV